MPSEVGRYAKRVDKKYAYGTAGFREKDDELPFIMYRMGMLAAIRSKVKLGQNIGIMITASHNPEGENGVKLIDPKGEMLESSWEQLATDLVNARNEEVREEIEKICKLASLSSHDYNCQSALVRCARDNRSSGPDLLKAVEAGVRSISNSSCFDEGLLTTPQLHFIIKSTNYPKRRGSPDTRSDETEYYRNFSSAFNALNSARSSHGLAGGLAAINYDRRIYVDAANGVGGANLAKLAAFLDKGLLEVTIVNSGEGPLNEKCGADYVKVGRRLPQVYNSNIPIESMAKWASFDGDADRIVYYYVDSKEHFHLLDGDKIAILFATFIGELLEALELSDKMKIGIVQTAYANGSSTSYIQDKLPHVHIYCTPTGVKHLHKQAELLDVGVYFEANGHGTVLFSDNCKMILKTMSENTDIDDHKRKVARQMLTFVDMINEAIGDAMTDLLAVETILKYKDWSVENWDALYTDVPSRQIKVKVADRNSVKTTNAERTCLEPLGLQYAIDSAVNEFRKSRAFVRPSGTEDIVRVYAEADTEKDVDELASRISKTVHRLCGGN